MINKNEKNLTNFKIQIQGNTLKLKIVLNINMKKLKDKLMIEGNLIFKS